MRRGGRFVALLLLFAGLTACDPAEAEAVRVEPAAAARAESPFGSLEVELPASELRTVDTLAVAVTLTRESGVAAGELVFEAEASGWTVAAEGAPSTGRSAGGGLATRWTFELEPFLDGVYPIPSASIELRPVGADPVVLATPVQSVTVTSVFLAEEEAVLAPARPLIMPEVAADERPYWFAAAIGAAVFVVAAGVVVTRRLARPRHAPEMPAVLGDARTRAGALQRRLAERLARLAGAPQSAYSADELAPLAAQCPWIRDRDAVARLLRDLEVAAYGPIAPSDAELAELEQRIARMLETLDPSTPGGDEA